MNETLVYKDSAQAGWMGLIIVMASLVIVTVLSLVIGVVLGLSKPSESVAHSKDVVAEVGEANVTTS